MLRILVFVAVVFALSLPLAAQYKGCSHNLNAEGVSAPPRPETEGEGPFEQLILRGATFVDGAGAPARGPVDIVIEGNRIKKIVDVGYPQMPIKESRRPKAKEGAKEIDCRGCYVLPGFIDMHGHIGGKDQGTTAEYVFKLWLGHGITTIREPGSFNGLDWTLEHKDKSAANTITAPRIFSYSVFGQGRSEAFESVEDVQEWVAATAKKGADGIKFFGAPPHLMRAALDAAREQGLRSACHHAQLNVARMNALDTARWGLTTMEHWYGLPEALFVDRRIQDYPADYNYNDEQHRFEEAGRLWKQAAPPFSEHWNYVMNELLELDFTINPTFTIYEGSRDLMRVRRAEWHEDYTLPSLWDYFAPSRAAHGSYWFNWGTRQEVAWKENYRLWMAFINEYKNRGGRVTCGSDCGYIYKLYGFDYIREIELLVEAGFHPLEAIRAATLAGAEALGHADELGSIEVGKLADLVVVPGNPLDNLKVLYGTGAIKLNAENEVIREGGVRWTIKDGIVFDAPQLLADVRAMVTKVKEETGRKIVQPGVQER